MIRGIEFVEQYALYRESPGIRAFSKCEREAQKARSAEAADHNSEVQKARSVKDTVREE